ncbi:MAG: twin-arginine translocase TatA/TatE family subunit [Bacteroidetes bacterium]|nr:twin-arginine translocase TatA/TatE family subunit [Bacteroidota bacterium]
MSNFLLFFNISGGEILLIVIVVYLVFGPKKIPELARMLGKGINELRRATDDIRSEISREANKIKKDINLDIDDPLEEITKRRKREQKNTPKSASDQANTAYSEPGDRTEEDISKNPDPHVKNEKGSQNPESTASKKKSENSTE